MEKILKLVLIISVFMTLAGCKKEPDPVGIAGEWKLESINGVPAENMAADEYGSLDIYISFSDDGKFETFQRISGGEHYYRFSGTYTRAGRDVVSGIYSDGNSWAADYTVARESDRLTMTGGDDTCVYVSASIPDDVRDSAIEVKSGQDCGAGFRFL